MITIKIFLIYCLRPITITNILPTLILMAAARDGAQTKLQPNTEK